MVEASNQPAWALRFGGDAAGVADDAADFGDVGAVGDAFGLDGVGGVDGHDDAEGDAPGGAVGGPGAAGVAGGGDGDVADAEFVGAGHADGRAAGLEGAGGVGAFVLKPQVVEAELFSQAVESKQGGCASAEVGGLEGGRRAGGVRGSARGPAGAGGCRPGWTAARTASRSYSGRRVCAGAVADGLEHGGVVEFAGFRRSGRVVRKEVKGRSDTERARESGGAGWGA